MVDVILSLIMGIARYRMFEFCEYFIGKFLPHFIKMSKMEAKTHVFFLTSLSLWF